MPLSHDPRSRLDDEARSDAWEDLDLARLERFTARSAEIGWRGALREIEAERPFFAQRLRNLSLGNWHLLRALPASSRALDVGCGFGTLALGLADYYREVVGLDALWSRIAYAALRARQEPAEGRGALELSQGSGLALPFRSGAFDLVTMNGVLEWAGLYARGGPRALQLRMLREIGRVLAPAGTLAVAIENRYAMETLVGMPDTHTGLRLAPALPRFAAQVLSLVANRAPFRTYLYDASGYRRLLHDAGYASVRVLDLISSYNDYDFVVDPVDAASYRLLWSRGLVRSFHSRAGRARAHLARRCPSSLGRFGYAFLLLAGAETRTVLDAEHPLWARAAAAGVLPGSSRFACQGTAPGSLVIVGHDGTRITGALELTTHDPGDAPIALPPELGEALALAAVPASRWSEDRITVRCFRTAGGV